MGDVIEGHVEAALGEDLAGRREDAFAVAGRVLAEGTLGGIVQDIGSRHAHSLAPKR